MKSYLVSIFIALLLCNSLVWGSFDPINSVLNNKFSPLHTKWAFEQNMSSCYSEIPMICKVGKIEELPQFERSREGFFATWYGGGIWGPYLVLPDGVLNRQGGGKFEIRLPIITYRQWLRSTKNIPTDLPDDFPLACICHARANSSYIKDRQYVMPDDSDKCINECLYNCMRQY